MKTGLCDYNALAAMPVLRIPVTNGVAIGLVASTAVAGAAASVRTFEGDAVGRPPAGFTFHVVRQQSPAVWSVQRNGDNSFLEHPGDPGGREGFALAILDREPRGRIGLSARIRLAGGTRAGGVVWRVQDPDNYYLARLDLERQDIGLYRVVKGNRVRIEGEDDLELDRTAWHTLKVVQESENIRVYLGGIRVLRARDRTFEDRGAVGVWCTADSTAHFDDLRLDQGAEDAGPRRGR
jgi:hypothetical protein